MQIRNNDKIYNFMGQSKLFIAISIVLVLASYALLFTKGLNYGIDFAGGTLIQVKYDQKAPIKKMRESLSKDISFTGATITEFGSPDEVIIKLPTTSSSVTNDLSAQVTKLLSGSGNFDIRRIDVVGPKIGSELREKGLFAMLLSIIAILIYIAIRFQWKFGIASIIALIHDVSISLGALALFQIDVNLDILAALLTILGYSLNDTIIVFDRIRESIFTSKIAKLFEIINFSVSKTLSRTTLTSLTTFFVVLSLFLFGGEIIHGFSFALLVGIVVGTYSSIFIASPFLKYLQFDIVSFRQNIAKKEKRAKEKAKMRAMYENGGRL